MATGDISARLQHEVLEDLTVLSALNGVEVGADQLDAVLRENPLGVQRHCRVERGLSPKGRQNRVRLLLCDDRFKNLGGNRLDVCLVRKTGIGHDGGGVRVHQDDPNTLLPKHAARLGAGVVKLGCLSNDNRAGPNHQHTRDISAFWHTYTPPFVVLRCSTTRFRKSSNR